MGRVFSLLMGAPVCALFRGSRRSLPGLNPPRRDRSRPGARIPDLATRRRQRVFAPRRDATRWTPLSRWPAVALVGAWLAAAPAAFAAHETVHVGSTLGLPPFEFVDRDGNVRGFEIDVLQAIGERLKLHFEYVKTPFSQAFVGLAARKFRLNASTIYIRCERIAGSGRVGHFTVPVFDVSLAITAQSSRPEITRSLEALAGLTVGVESRGSGPDALVEANRDRIGFQKVLFDSTTSLFLGLRQGRADAAIQSEPVARYVARQAPGLVVGAPLPGTEVPVGFLFREGDPLRLRFNDAIDTLKRNGRLAEIYRVWFGVLPAPSSLVARPVPEVTLETCRSSPAPPHQP